MLVDQGNLDHQGFLALMASREQRVILDHLVVPDLSVPRAFQEGAHRAYKDPLDFLVHQEVAVFLVLMVKRETQEFQDEASKVPPEKMVNRGFLVRLA